MKTVAIIQARMLSTRLPGKIFQDIAGKPMLSRVIERTIRARHLDVVGIATSTDTTDDRVEEYCKAHGILCYRGSMHDVLDRYHGAACAWKADYVVRISSDCPLIDPEVVDRVVDACVRAEGKVEYANNFLPVRTFPRGLELESFPFRILDYLWKVDTNPGWREHVTGYIDQKPEEFRIECIINEIDESCHRWTVDTVEDLELVRRIYGVLGDAPFSWREVLQLVKQHPDWSALNRKVVQKVL